MLQTFKNAFKNKDIRNKVLLTIFLLFMYRLGCWIPVPGIDNASLIVTNSEGGVNQLFQLLSAIGGQALSNGTLLAIGISPYINASIIVQLLTVAIPQLERMTKQGDEGKRKIETVTRWVTLALAIAQAVGISISWYNAGSLTNIFNANDLKWVAVIVAVIMIAGAMFTLWLGEKITDIGVGNGMSLLIFIGIIATAGLAIEGKVVEIFTSSGTDQATAIWTLLGFFAMVLIIFVFIIWIDLAERKIPVNYAKQVKGRKQYGGQSTHIPIKINANGVLPIIFATAIITFPSILFSLIFAGKTNGFLNFWNKYIGTGTVVYFILMGLLILFFSYFYAQVQFNPDEVARNLQQYGGTLTGIRPGKPTSDYLRKVSKRLTLAGAIFLMIIAVVPSILFSQLLPDASLVNAFSATGMLIVVSVALELHKQLEGQLMMQHYKGFLK